MRNRKGTSALQFPSAKAEGEVQLRCVGEAKQTLNGDTTVFHGCDG